MCYYHNKDFIEDHELVPEWDLKWESPNEDFNFDVNLDIDSPQHIEEYLDWWQGCNIHNLGIHGVDQVEDNESEEGIGGAQTRWDTSYTQIGQDQYGLVDVYEEVPDARYDDNEDTNSNINDYKPNVGEDIDVDEDDDDDDNINSFLLLLN